MVAGVYFNATTAPGVGWSVTSSTVTNGTIFSVDGQSSTNTLIVRNMYWHTAGSAGAASTDMIWVYSTQSVPSASGLASPQNSFHMIIIGTTYTLQLKNNSGTTIIYALDGEVLRV